MKNEEDSWMNSIYFMEAIKPKSIVLELFQLFCSQTKVYCELLSGKAVSVLGLLQILHCEAQPVPEVDNSDFG